MVWSNDHLKYDDDLSSADGLNPYMSLRCGWHECSHYIYGFSTVSGLREHLEESKHVPSFGQTDTLFDNNIATNPWLSKEAQYLREIESFRIEIENMLLTHAFETSELWKKISILTEQVRKMQSTATSTSSSTGITINNSVIAMPPVGGIGNSQQGKSAPSSEPEARTGTSYEPETTADFVYVSFNSRAAQKRKDYRPINSRKRQKHNQENVEGVKVVREENPCLRCKVLKKRVIYVFKT
jgi:hypothetical protein